MTKAKIFLTKLTNLPFILIALIVLISILGFISLYSAAEGSFYPWAYKQIMHFIIFLFCSVIIAIIDIKLIYKSVYYFYFITLLLLLGVEFFGVTTMGAKRWLDIFGLKIQPSELIKLSIVLFLAKYFHNLKKYDKEINHLKNLLLPIIASLVPIGLIIKQPDLGTGIITFVVAATMFFIAGVAISKFIIFFIFFLLSAPIIWYIMYEYQRKRILMFLSPEQDPLGAGYNIIQSKIAIGSGGIFGKGFLHGTQSHLSFLPEHQTDFIFSSFAEEFGFIGSAALLLLYSIIIVLCIIIGAYSKIDFAKLMSVGAITIFFSHICINMAMVMGLMPVVGVPLPLVSYGGTMMSTILIAFGLIMNSYINRYSRFI